jgi:hypothetical protein
VISLIDPTKHSIWLSAKPTSNGKGNDNDDTWSSYKLPSDDSFFYLGGENSYSYSNSYNATTTGVYAQGSTGALFVDSGSGSVSNINVSAVRIQPDEPYDPTPSDTQSIMDMNLNNCSNARLIEVLRNMRGVQQLNQGAYILRLYNSSMIQGTEDQGYDLPVYLASVTTSIEMDSPNTLKISLSFVRRSPVKNINIGTTNQD